MSATNPNQKSPNPKMMGNSDKDLNKTQNPQTETEKTDQKDSNSSLTYELKTEAEEKLQVLNKKTSNTGRLWQMVKILRKYKITRGIDPVKLRHILEDLGPTYVKIGQMLSTRADIFSKRYTDELVKLREDVNPLPFSEIEIALQAFYGNPYEIYEWIDPKPLGSASMSQVHKAKLKTGETVVIKVKRPGIYEQMEEDVKLLNKACSLLKIADVGNGVVDFHVVLDEFWQTAKEEMDFTIEANHAIRFRKQYEDIEYINAPLIYRQYSNRDILVMEYIDGYEISNKEGLECAGYDLDEIADKLSYNYICQIVDQGFFHADPHSGNLRIKDGQIVWIDFGMMSTLTGPDKELMKNGIQAVATQNTPLLVDTILTLGVPQREVDYSALMMDMSRFMNSYLSTDLKDIDIVSMVSEIFEICHKYAIMLPKGISMLARSLMTIEGTLVQLHPGLNIANLVANHLDKLSESDLKKEISQVFQRMGASTNAMIDLPSQTSTLMKMMERGQIKVNLSLTGINAGMANVNRMVNRTIICILDAALLMASAIICTTHMTPQFLGIPLLGLFGFLVSMCLSLWLFFKMLFLHRKNRLF